METKNKSEAMAALVRSKIARLAAMQDARAKEVARKIKAA